MLIIQLFLLHNDYIDEKCSVNISNVSCICQFFRHVNVNFLQGPFTGASMNTVRTFAPALLGGNLQYQWVCTGVKVLKLKVKMLVSVISNI